MKAGVHRRYFLKAASMAAGWPLCASAQTTGLPVIGFLSPQSAGPGTAGRIAGFLAGLAELQYVEGQNVRIEYRWSEGRYDRLRELADDLVRRKVAVIAAATQDAALAARLATATIPTVFNVGGDPVALGLVTSMSRPGGNATGVSMFTNQLEAKRLGLLHDIVPNVTTVGVFVNPANASSESQLASVHAAARELGLQIQVRRIGSGDDFAPAFESLIQAGARALMVGADPYFAAQREPLIALAAKHRLPAIWEWPDFVEAGGLMSYGTSIVDNYRQIGVYVGRILKGESPATMPVVRPVNFVLAVNLRTASALGIQVPPTLLAGADSVIE